MADNTSQTGTDTIATDDIGGVKYQRAKVVFGADGAATDVSAAAPLPVTADINAALPAGTNAVGNVGVIGRTSGGLSTSTGASAASNNATSVKASAGQVFGWAVYNNTSSNKFFKLYNKASSPSPGTDNALLLTRVMVPANSGSNFHSDIGIAFGTGIAFAIVTGASDTDNTSVAANDVLWNLYYA